MSSVQNKAHSIAKVVAFSGISLALNACVPYPHSVAVNPLIEGNLVSVESNKPVAGAKLTLDIDSDMSRTYKATSDVHGRFAFAAHSDFRLLALLADAPAVAPRCPSRRPATSPATAYG
ncbi:MAG: hypothetical protein Q8R10_18165 [Pseudomonas sp.]|uniref:hypothetical protein n=1 Tax=Pseudomonas sp. TaxID=306 RepID=UPI0027362FE3|nr:hypothetical protein [Pseudomonas sp.]MDP3848346.1 hypothetical protein [Pseudomonas sp.]